MYLSGWINKYCKDLTEGLITEFGLARNIPNSELVFIGEKWGSKVDLKYDLRPVGNFTEVTISLKYRLILEPSARIEMIDIIRSLLMLEKGYKARDPHP